MKILTKRQFEKRLRQNLGEAVHNSFRKGPTSGSTAMVVHRAITDMDDQEWKEVLDWLAWALSETVSLDKDSE